MLHTVSVTVGAEIRSFQVKGSTLARFNALQDDEALVLVHQLKPGLTQPWVTGLARAILDLCTDLSTRRIALTMRLATCERNRAADARSLDIALNAAKRLEAKIADCDADMSKLQTKLAEVDDCFE